MILEDNIEEVRDRLDQVAEAEEEVRMMRDEMRRKLEVVERCKRRLVALGFKVNLYHILGSTDGPACLVIIVLSAFYSWRRSPVEKARLDWRKGRWKSHQSQQHEEEGETEEEEGEMAEEDAGRWKRTIKLLINSIQYSIAIGVTGYI